MCGPEDRKVGGFIIVRWIGIAPEGVEERAHNLANVGRDRVEPQDIELPSKPKREPGRGSCGRFYVTGQPIMSLRHEHAQALQNRGSGVDAGTFQALAALDELAANDENFVTRCCGVIKRDCFLRLAPLPP